MEKKEKEFWLFVSMLIEYVLSSNKNLCFFHVSMKGKRLTEIEKSLILEATIYLMTQLDILREKKQKCIDQGDVPLPLPLALDFPLINSSTAFIWAQANGS